MTVQPQRSQADHRPYIEQVRLALLLKDVHLGAPVLSVGKLRSAAMTILPPDQDFDEPWHPSFAGVGRVELRWSEEDGWSLLAAYLNGQAGPTVWHCCFAILPPPEEVVGWLGVLLTKPQAPPGRVDGPFRSHQELDHDFEAALAVYVH